MGWHQDLHYHCLLRLHGEMLRKFLEGQAAASEAWCRSALRDIPDDCVDAPPLPDPQDDDVEPDMPPPPGLLPLQLDRNLDEWHRCEVCYNLKKIRITFDHHTGSTRGQRGYANCFVHSDCIRWRACSLFRDRSHYAAYMLAWGYLR